jgi:uncharacterized protein (TIGR02594 family)
MLPAPYTYLDTIGTLPKMIASAIQYLGIREVPGKGSNPVIMNMAEGLGLKGIYTDDDMSWCAVFIGHLCKVAGKPLPDTKGDKYNLMRAFSYTWWGSEVTKKDAMLGDVIVKKRKGGFHVCLYVGESTNTFHVIGGNQSNSVTFAEIKKSEVIAVRRLYAIAPPASVKKYIISSTGVVGGNEA